MIGIRTEFTAVKEMTLIELHSYYFVIFIQTSAFHIIATYEIKILIDSKLLKMLYLLQYQMPSH